MLKKFSGNIPWALAAYNAGPERMDRWNRARKLPLTASSEPFQEIWIDELPWSETNIYVKSILRNLLVYRLLDKGRVQLTEPLWK